MSETTVEGPYSAARSELLKEVDRRVLQRVQEGIKLLEEKHGPDWVEKFGGLEDFDISHGLRCVLGKLYGNYDDGLRELNLKSSGQEYGFSTSEDVAIPDQWGQLQKAWEFELGLRGVPA